MSGRQAYLDLLGKKPRADEEEQLQRSLVDLLHVAAVPDVIWWHTPNGMARSKSEGGRLKAMGVLPGVYDLAFIVPTPFDTFVFPFPHFLELKRPRGVESPAQIAFAERCDRIGVPHAVTSDFDHAVAILTAWGVLARDVK